ncbi:LysR family transcriptional regulator [Roseateles terrae]|uniref:DNA-binding transcriptional LysR family regulator n=1 Tax=Roseateles terrae TaxID=431060 RepID=A0ABR6GTC5_9BURK|nr:LysR family transcriptional regulator [Roseateles terrae]MBB3195341.1 DNA-binding transcriptional LysR family regulator [Roseateles terrae]OWQ87332.1 LysR family transcriptional regulator [Roseateles terrae]
MTSSIAWEWYRSFMAVLREGSLSRAARVLDLTQPTVGRHIAALESATGQALFIRTPAGLVPTEAAQALRPLAEAMDSTAAALERTARSRGDGVQGVVRITASEMVGVEVLPTVLASLREEHPGLVVELVISNQVQDLLRREADIAIRMTQPRQEALIARHVGVIEVGLHAHARYLQKRGTPQTLDDLKHDGHTLIGYDSDVPYVRELARRFPSLARDRFSLRANSDQAQFALIRAGAGIGLCQVALARRDPALRRVLADALTIPLDTWITMHEDLRHSPRCRVVFDALVEGLSDHVALGAPAGGGITNPSQVLEGANRL